MTGRIAIVTLLVGLMSLFGLAPTAAHSQLIVSDPAADAVTDVLPVEVALTFDQNINSEFATITVTDSAGANWVIGSPSVSGPVVRVVVDPALGAAEYTVAYRVVSADGHPITGSYRFTHTAPAAASASPAAASSPTAPTSVAPAATDSPDGAANTALLWIFAAAVAGLLAGGVIAVVRKPHRRR